MIPISTRGIADSERVLLGKPYAGSPGSTEERMVGNWRVRLAAVRTACPFQPLAGTVRQGRLRRCVRLTPGPASIHPGQIGPVVFVIHLCKIAQRIEGRQVSAEWPRFARAGRDADTLARFLPLYCKPRTTRNTTCPDSRPVICVQL